MAGGVSRMEDLVGTKMRLDAMTQWREIGGRVRAADLSFALQRHTSTQKVCYTFVHDDLEVEDPSLDVSGRFFTSPKEYGFGIRGFADGKTAWARDFANGTMLVVNEEGLSHVLRPRGTARVIFLGLDGNVLQDTGAHMAERHAEPDLATIRLAVTVDLNGQTLEEARAQLLRRVGSILLATASNSSEMQVLDYAVDSIATLPGELSNTSRTDFSQLLGI